MTESELKLREFDKQLDLDIIKFNDLHREAKHLKQKIGIKYIERNKILKEVAIDRQRGAFAD